MKYGSEASSPGSRIIRSRKYGVEWKVQSSEASSCAEVFDKSEIKRKPRQKNSQKKQQYNMYGGKKAKS